MLSEPFFDKTHQYCQPFWRFSRWMQELNDEQFRLQPPAQNCNHPHIYIYTLIMIDIMHIIYKYYIYSGLIGL